MIFGQLRNVRETREIGLRVAVRQAMLRQHVHEFGDGLHRKLGTPGVLASGFGAGFLFDRLRPRWRGVHSAGGLGLALLRLAPLLHVFKGMGGDEASPE